MSKNAEKPTDQASGGTGAPSDPPAEIQPPSDGKKSPREWFSDLAPKGENKLQRSMRLAEHNAAATIHGWFEHTHHESKPIRLSGDDYKLALKAAASGQGRKALHAPACSPHNGKGI